MTESIDCRQGNLCQFYNPKQKQNEKEMLKKRFLFHFNDSRTLPCARTHTSIRAF